MKKNIFCILIILFFAGNAFSQERWHEFRGAHFLIYYKNSGDDFVDRVLERAEDYYETVTEKLNFRRYNFWLNEGRVKIYIYDDKESYQKEAREPEWSGGCVNIEKKTILTFAAASVVFVNHVLPHELGHIILREFIGLDNFFIPLWFDEGVAGYFERQDNRAYSKRLIKKAIDEGEFISLKNLSLFNPRQTKDIAKISLFYAEALNAVEFLIQEHGQDNFSFFCEKLRDKKDFDLALAAVYPYVNLEEFGKEWQQYLEE